MRGADRRQGADLGDDHRGNLFRGGPDLPPPEPLAVGVARMGPDDDPRRDGPGHGLAHDHRIPGVGAAGDVGGGDEGQHRRLCGDPVDPEAFAEVGVQVDGGHGILVGVT